MPITYTYQWKKVDPNTGTATPISGATSSTYTVQYTEQGSEIRCTVTADNGTGTASADSNTTAIITNVNKFFNRIKTWHKAVGAVVAAVLITGSGVIVYNQISPAPSSSINANVFIATNSTTGASTSCTASATLIDYATALANNHVCKGNGTTTQGFDNACTATKNLAQSGGMVIGWKPGVYPVFAANSQITNVNQDCSGGQGATVNPNCAEMGVSCTNTTANWTTVKCADGDGGGTVEISGQQGIEMVGAAYHTIIAGSCYQWDSDLILGLGGSLPVVSELQFIGTSQSTPMRMFNYNLTGPTDVMLKNISVGPAFACGKIDANTPSALQCTTNSWWDTQYSTFGTSTSSCNISTAGNCGGSLSLGAPLAGEPYVHNGAGGVQFSHIRIQNLYEHDQVAVCSNGTCQHPGCMLTGGDENHSFGDLVIDHLTCERVSTEGIELHVGGTIIQNSVFACPTNPLDGSGGIWAQCTSSGSAELGIGATIQLQNILIRHNDFLGCSTSATNPSASAGFSNVRIIGNIYGCSAGGGCSITGVTYDYNTYYNSVTACGTNSQSISDPLVDSNPGTSLPTPYSTAPTQLNLSIATSVQGVPNNGSPNSDYQLGFDSNGDARNSSTTNAGAVGP